MSPVAAALIIFAGLAVFAWQMSFRLRPLLFARKDVRWDKPGDRTARLPEYGLGQKRLPSKPERTAGMAHIVIFAALLLAQVATLTAFGLAFDEHFRLPLFNDANVGGRAF